MSLELTHIGEALVARLLTRLATEGQLNSIRCERTGVRLADDLGSNGSVSPVFLPNGAQLRIVTSRGTLMCDGAQQVDVLCVGSQTLAMELKLGETRLTPATFSARFLEQCEMSAHQEPRLKGKMPAVLERRFPTGVVGSLEAYDDEHSWAVADPWWLVLRESVWNSWKSSGGNPLPTRNARILVFERLVAAHGSASDFDEAVAEVIGTGFAARWRVA